MSPGTRVEVRSRFDAGWSRGFEIAEIVQDRDAPGYRVRRRSDGSVLPAIFDHQEVREEKRDRMWWH